MQRFKFPLSIAFACCVFPAIGQILERQVVATAAVGGASADVSISSTVGETVVHSFASGNLILSQGFQQGDLDGLGPAGIEDISALLTAYPNPAGDMVNLRVDGIQKEMRAELFSLDGRKMLPEAIHLNGSETRQIFLGSIPSGQYILRVSSKDNEQQGFFKIIKIR